MRSMEERLAACQRIRAEVDLGAIHRNVESMKANMDADTKIIAVIKADGYGHGSVEIARELEMEECVWGFAVATAEEAFALRHAGIRKGILVLGYTFPYAYEELVQEDIRPAVFREDMLAQMAEAAAKRGKRLKIHIKVDTGMGRIGITPDERGIGFLRKVLAYPQLEPEGIFTHFARADEADKSSAREQLERFWSFIHSAGEQLGMEFPIRHCSNSAGIIELPEANMDAVRAGITLYGLYPSKEVSLTRIPLEPALSLYSSIVYIKTIHKGQSVSYGGTFTAPGDTRVATIPAGYGDGYPRSLSGKGYVLLHGKKAPILGRVCMDQFMVDVTHIPQAQEGDKVTLIGRDGAEQISAETLGGLSGRFNYELVCDLGKRIPRVYYKDGKIISCSDYFAQ